MPVLDDQFVNAGHIASLIGKNKGGITVSYRADNEEWIVSLYQFLKASLVKIQLDQSYEFILSVIGYCFIDNNPPKSLFSKRILSCFLNMLIVLIDW